MKGLYIIIHRHNWWGLSRAALKLNMITFSFEIKWEVSAVLYPLDTYANKAQWYWTVRETGQKKEKEGENSSRAASLLVEKVAPVWKRKEKRNQRKKRKNKRKGFIPIAAAAVRTTTMCVPMFRNKWGRDKVFLLSILFSSLHGRVNPEQPPAPLPPLMEAIMRRHLSQLKKKRAKYFTASLKKSFFLAYKIICPPCTDSRLNVARHSFR